LRQELKKMKLDEMKQLSAADLTKQIEVSKKALLDLRFKLATRQLVNHQDIRKTKKDIARLETLRKQKTLSA
jgi:large subunit ribosomal protein L29